MTRDTSKALGVLASIGFLLAGCAEPPQHHGAAQTPEHSSHREAPATPAAGDSSSAEAAAGVLRAYYDLIAAHDYRGAYLLWGNEGAASGKTFDAFAAGFANTAGVSATVGAPGGIEAAAGSRYIEIPIQIHARTNRGEEQRFSGTYVLRRSEVDGATAEQQRWHLYSAKIQQQRP